MLAKQLPPIVTALTYRHKAWVVGSAAPPESKMSALGDIDVIVPFSERSSAACLIPDSAVKTKFGGWRFKDRNIMVDVWPDDLANLFLSQQMRTAWQPLYGIRISKK